nr:alpha-N-acetylgalactosaminide alpha-2,6-sialyltransferase 6 isoform X5 [Meriones unguiculatus]
MACSRPPSQCDPTTLPPGPPAGRWPLPLSRRRREMSSNKEQRSAVFVVLFALITILILYSSNSANEVFHYGSLRGRTRRPINLKKWSFSNAYFPILGNKGKVPFLVEHGLVYHGDRGGAVRPRARVWHGPSRLLQPAAPPAAHAIPLL